MTGRLTRSATPLASVRLLAKLRRMSWRTMPESSSTSGPFDRSPGYGPAASRWAPRRSGGGPRGARHARPGEDGRPPAGADDPQRSTSRCQLDEVPVEAVAVVVGFAMRRVVVHDAIVGPQAVSFLGNRSDLAARRHRIEPRTGRVGHAAQRALVAGVCLHGGAEIVEIEHNFAA